MKFKTHPNHNTTKVGFLCDICKKEQIGKTYHNRQIEKGDFITIHTIANIAHTAANSADKSDIHDIKPVTETLHDNVKRIGKESGWIFGIRDICPSCKKEVLSRSNWK
jgi:hypothetical protein